MATMQAAPTRHRHTEQFSGMEYLPTQYLTSQYQEGGRDGKNQSTKCKQQAIATTLCKELQASNCVYKSQGAPARGLRPPLL